jgi:hypothetical protein
MNHDYHHEKWERITDDFGRPSLFVPVGFGEDYDRCFGNTSETMRVTLNTLDEIAGISSEAVQREQARVEAEHKPFNTVETIVHMLEETGSPASWDHDVKPAILARAERQHHQDRLLTMGSQAVIAEALTKGYYPLVVTYGAIEEPRGERQKWTAREWQSTKVAMTPVLRDHPLVVSEERSKGKLFATWETTLHGEPVMLLPRAAWLSPDMPVYIKEMLLVDDKKDTFTDFEKNMYGIHYLPESDDDVRVAQINGEYPVGNRVVLARGMGRVAEHLRCIGDEMPSEYFRHIDINEKL